MNKAFLEFWGNLFIQASKGQQRLEETSKWMQQGFSGYDEFSKLFHKFYGLDEMTKSSPDYNALWESATESFKTQWSEYLDLMDVVPKRKYAELSEKYEKLELKAKEQKKTIERLRGLLYQKASNGDKTMTAFQELIENQSKEFKDLADSFESFLNRKSKKND